jgi:hypothetical protein
LSRSLVLALLVGCSQPKPRAFDCDPLPAPECSSAAVTSSATTASTSPEATFALMQSAACAGDANGFFARVDEPRWRLRLAKLIADRAKPRPEILTEEQYQGALLVAAKQTADETIKEWREEIAAKKTASAICTWKKIGASGDTVQIRRLESGETSTLTFTRIGGEYFMTSFEADHTD